MDQLRSIRLSMSITAGVKVPFQIAAVNITRIPEVEFESEVSEVAEKVAEKLSQTDQAILDAVEANPEVSQSAIAEKLKMTRQYIGRRMDELQIRKVIRRVGPDKGGHWEVL